MKQLNAITGRRKQRPQSVHTAAVTKEGYLALMQILYVFVIMVHDANSAYHDPVDEDEDEGDDDEEEVDTNEDDEEETYFCDDWVLTNAQLLRIKKQQDLALEFFDHGYDDSYDALTNLLPLLRKNAAPPDEEFFDFTAALKKDFKKLSADKRLSRDQLSLLNSARVYLDSCAGSDNTWKILVNKANLLGDPDLAAEMEEWNSEMVQRRTGVDPDAQLKDARANLSKFIKTTTGSPLSQLTPEQVVQLKADDPEAFKKYSKHLLTIRDLVKARIRGFIRNTGEPLVNVAEIRSFLSSARIPNTIPDGFVGKMDDLGKYYTTEGVLCVGTPGGEVKMNPQYDAKADNAYVCQYRREGDAGFTKVYTVAYKKEAQTKNFSNSRAFLQDIDTMMKRWHADIFSEDWETALLASITQIIYLTGARIGSKSDAINSGLCTWIVGDLRSQRGGYKISYTGKSYGQQVHWITPDDRYNKQVISYLKHLTQDRSKKEPLWLIADKRGNARQINANDVNAYLKRISGGLVTAKMFRTALGSRVFKDEMDNSLVLKKVGGRTPITTTEAMAEFKRLAEQVGKFLGHYRSESEVDAQAVAGATAIAAYVDPSLMLEFWERVGIRPPANIEKRLQAVGL